MASTIIPEDQFISIDPYSGKLFDFNNASSRIYLSRTINNLLRALGTDVVLEGLSVKTKAYNATTHILTVRLNPGKVIIDTTLIEIFNETVVSIDLSGYSNTGFIAIFLSYKFAESLFNNESQIKIRYVAEGNTVTYPEMIETNTDRILLSTITITGDTPDTYTLSIDDNMGTIVNICNENYEVLAASNLGKEAVKYLKKMVC